MLATLILSLAVPQEPGIADFRALHRQIVPARAEAWEAIPWRTDLLAAAAEARSRGQPLFVWSMNGHPLGCV